MKTDSNLHDRHLQLPRRVERLLTAVPEPVLDGLASRLMKEAQAPAAFIAIISGGNRHHKALVGIQREAVRTLYRAHEHTIANASLTAIADMLRDDRTCQLPEVVSEPRLRSYCAVPLLVGGKTLGCVGVLDFVVREFSSDQRDSIIKLAEIVSLTFQELSEGGGVNDLSRRDDTQEPVAALRSGGELGGGARIGVGIANSQPMSAGNRASDKGRELNVVAGNDNEKIVEQNRPVDKIHLSEAGLWGWTNDHQSLCELLFDKSPIAKFLARENVIFNCNQAALDMLDVDAKHELIGKDFSELLATLQRSSHGKSVDVRELIRNGHGIARCDWLFQRSDGSVIPCDVSLHALGPTADFVVLAVCRDTSEIALGRQELEHTRDRLELALHAGNVGLWDWDLKSDQVYYSDEWHRLIGEQPDSLHGLEAWQQRIHPDDRQMAEQRLYDLFESAASDYESTFRFKHADGSYRWIRAKGRLVRDHAGHPQRLLGVHLDATNEMREHDRQIQELRRSEIVHCVLEQGIQARHFTKLGVLLTQEARRFIGTHQAVLRVCTERGTNKFIESRSFSEKYREYKCADVNDATAVIDMIANEEVDLLLNERSNAFRASQEELEAHPLWPVVEQRLKGHPPLQGLLYCPLTDSDGIRIGILWLSDKYAAAFTQEDSSLLTQFANIASLAFDRLLTERSMRLQTQRLLASNRDLEQFAYVASHDLQQPLRTIANYASFLEQDCSSQLDEKGLGYLAKQQAAVEQMKMLINDLLQYARINSCEAALEQFPFADVVRAALRNLQAAIEESSAKIAMDALPTVIGFRSRLVQLVQNLVENAIKYSGGKTPEISIDCKDAGDSWRFRVADKGVGIDAPFHEEIFRVFRRLRETSQVSGTGVGLAICKKIVELHAGEIWVESQLGEGSSFHFDIPKSPILLQKPPST